MARDSEVSGAGAKEGDQSQGVAGSGLGHRVWSSGPGEGDQSQGAWDCTGGRGHQVRASRSERGDQNRGAAGSCKGEGVLGACIEAKGGRS